MKVQFENGSIVEFDGEPTEQDIQSAARHVFAVPPSDDAPKDEWDRYYKATITPKEPSLLETEVLSPIKSALSTGLTAGIAKEAMPKDVKSAIFPEQQTLPGKALRVGLELGASVAGLPGKLTLTGMKAASKLIPRAVVPAEMIARASVGQKLATGAIGGLIGSATMAPKDMDPIEYSKQVALGTAIGTPLPIVGATIVNKFPKLMSDEGLKQRIKDTVQNGIWKALRPSMAGKKTTSQIDKFDRRASTAVADIIANKQGNQFIDGAGNIKSNKLPEDLADTAKAIEDGRKRIFQEYNALTNQAGESGAIVDVENLQSILEKYATDPILEVENPALFNFANRQYKALSMRGKFTPLEAEQKIAEWNSDLKSQYRSSDFGVETNKQVIKEMVESLRKDLDSSIERATGSPAYQSLKNMYGAYRALADEIGRRLPVARRASPSSFFDVADAFASGEAVSGGIGVLTGDPSAPARLAKALGINVGKTILKRRNDPNIIIGNMFKDVDSLLNESARRSKSLQPAAGEVSKRFIQRQSSGAPLKGLNIEDVSTQSGDAIRDAMARGIQIEKKNGLTDYQAMLKATANLDKDPNFYSRTPSIGGITQQTSSMNSANIDLADFADQPWQGAFKANPEVLLSKVGVKTPTETLAALENWTAAHGKIRTGNPVDSQVIEEYIKKAPKWNKEAYRGIVLPEYKAMDLVKGDVVRARGVSSWTPNEEMAMGFATQRIEGVPVMFRTKKLNGVANFINDAEEELLASRDNYYRVIDTTSHMFEGAEGRVRGFIVDLAPSKPQLKAKVAFGLAGASILGTTTSKKGQ